MTREGQIQKGTEADTHAIVTLCNDAVIDWLYPFLNSLRHFEPEIDIYLIPFDDNLKETRNLCQMFNCQMVSDDTLNDLVEIGKMFCPSDKPTEFRSFRRLAAFWLPCDRFLYMDSDVITLGELGHYFDIMASKTLDFVYLTRDEPPLFRNKIYRYTRFRDMMKEKYQSPEFNPGVFFSRTGLFTMKTFRKLAEKAVVYSDAGLFYDDMEAPFLNYCVDVSSLRTAKLQDLDPSICQFPMAGVADFHQQTNGLWQVEYPWNVTETDRVIPMIHWNEVNSLPDIPNASIYRRFSKKNQ